MAKKITALVGAFLIAAAALAPSVASADPRYRGHGDRGYYDNHRGYNDGRYRSHRYNNNDDALAAGVVGLVLGAVIGSAVTQSNNNRRNDRYYAPPPPPPNYSGGYDNGPYYNGPPPQSYYEPQLCVQRQETWDPYAGRYVTLERRVPC